MRLRKHQIKTHQHAGELLQAIFDTETAWLDPSVVPEVYAAKTQRSIKEAGQTACASSSRSHQSCHWRLRTQPPRANYQSTRAWAADRHRLKTATYSIFFKDQKLKGPVGPIPSLWASCTVRPQQRHVEIRSVAPSAWPQKSESTPIAARCQSCVLATASLGSNTGRRRVCLLEDHTQSAVLELVAHTKTMGIFVLS